MAIRRIRQDLRLFLAKQDLTVEEQNFIKGCLKAQDRHPQLTSFQWSIVVEIAERYKYRKKI